MSNLFGILDLGARSLQTQQQGVAVTGQNMANVNNTAYARQRLNIQTATPVQTQVGWLGTGAEAASISSIRDSILDSQIISESGIRGSLAAQQSALQYSQASLGTQIDTLSGNNGSTHSLADELTGLFTSFQSVSASPTSMAERQALLMNASSLALRFNQVDKRLGDLNSSLNESLQGNVDTANQLLSDIADLNDKIRSSEIGSKGLANDLRDLRQAKLENLGELVNFTASEDNTGINISIGGVTFVSGSNAADQLETYDPGNGGWLIRAATAGTAITPTSGSFHGTIEARDGVIATMRSDLNDLASTLITEVNNVHATGYDLSGNTGEAFFTGTSAADIAVNTTLLNDPGRVQASSASGESGNNETALALAQLADANHASIGNQTFVERYGQIVADLGQSLSSVNTQLTDQETVEKMLQNQRQSVSGVSLDEELTNLTRFQQAFAASARIVTTVDEMLDTVINLKR